MHSVEKIGGTSMSSYEAVRDNIIFGKKTPSFYNRIFVVSAYSGLTDRLLEHKKSGRPGVYGLFACAIEEGAWTEAIHELEAEMTAINKSLFAEDALCEKADRFIKTRIQQTLNCLLGLQALCTHGHFSIETHLATVREMLASLGEAHSAWNMAQLLERDGVKTQFVDLTGWDTDKHLDLDDRIIKAFSGIDTANVMPIVTGYAHSEKGLMSTFDRGYSEMTFSRIAVLTQAREAVIHKEFHLSSADPRLVGEVNAVPIGRTNYDVADQLANLGMEAIHPKAAKGLRKSSIPLRIKNTFEPEHTGTLIDSDYVSKVPCVEIIAGRKGVYAIEVFDQEMTGNINFFDTEILSVLKQFNMQIISKDINANTITHYLATNIKNIERIIRVLETRFGEDVEISQRKVAIVSAIGSDMHVPGILAKTVSAIAESSVSVLAIHQCMRQVDMQFIVDEKDYEACVKSLHASLVEIHDHGRAICLAS